MSVGELFCRLCLDSLQLRNITKGLCVRCLTFVMGTKRGRRYWLNVDDDHDHDHVDDDDADDDDDNNNNCDLEIRIVMHTQGYLSHNATNTRPLLFVLYLYSPFTDFNAHTTLLSLVCLFLNVFFFWKNRFPSSFLSLLLCDSNL